VDSYSGILAPTMKPFINRRLEYGSQFSGELGVYCLDVMPEILQDAKKNYRGIQCS
jgi:hypothetical protein